MCDEIAIINHGEVIVRDRTETLLAQMDAKTLVIMPEGVASPVQTPDGVECSKRADGALVFSYHRSPAA